MKDFLAITKALSDENRLRAMMALAGGELCVCHLQAVLGEPQVKVSKHLAYLRRNGLVEARRSGSWMVYGIPDEPSPEISAVTRLFRRYSPAGIWSTARLVAAAALSARWNAGLSSALPSPTAP